MFRIKKKNFFNFPPFSLTCNKLDSFQEERQSIFYSENTQNLSKDVDPYFHSFSGKPTLIIDFYQQSLSLMIVFIGSRISI
ncbi:hypothetical protein DLAC_11738 [Tieghemostelium lacteum]|uniref:Uncharacterized protein n=1 Tax=Tieghemostelium lacteum TaxID=361077 RepID=A0A151Z7Z1_TIELA|nr:hypothetical protein DLAC_11738 [Tieghemostelium lacteum]|eukprot:KYQ90072.1 hypothetical protein DLAC_11738 [Tieghemostelium lacteum]